jgi:hypothetical protein
MAADRLIFLIKEKAAHLQHENDRIVAEAKEHHQSITSEIERKTEGSKQILQKL